MSFDLLKYNYYLQYHIRYIMCYFLMISKKLVQKIFWENFFNQMQPHWNEHYKCYRMLFITYNWYKLYTPGMPFFTIYF